MTEEFQDVELEDAGLEDGSLDIHDYDIMELFDKLSFKEKWQKVASGIKMPKDSGEYKYAKLQLVRLSGPVAAIIVPFLFMGLMILFASVTPPPPEVVEVSIIEPEPIEELEDIEEIEPPDPVEPEDIMDNLMDDVTVTMDDPTPTEEFSPQPQEFDAVALTKSPVIMKGIYGSLNSGKTGTSFMGGGGKGSRFAFVIDYSKSMKPDQLKVMKHELTKAIRSIGDKGMVTLLFFSGPVWRPDQADKTERPKWEGDNKKGWKLKKGEEGPDPMWLVPDEHNMPALERLIYTTKTTLGTDWYHPMKFVLDMDPRPDMVFFMTDGASSKGTTDKTVKYVEELPILGVVINTVVLGIDIKKAEPLKVIAESTHGKFRHYDDAEIKKTAAELPKDPDQFTENKLKYLSHEEARGRVAKKRAEKQAEADKDDIEISIQL